MPGFQRSGAWGRTAFRRGLLAVLLTAVLQLSPLAANISSAAGAPAAVNRGGHFHVVFYGPENTTAAHLISLVLEEAYRKVGADLLFWPTGSIGAVLYPKKDFFDITRSPSWVGAIYDGKIKMPAGGVVERTGELERVIFHEYTHALVYRLSRGRAPAWLNEGLAQYEEGVRRPGFGERAKALVAEGGMPLKSIQGSFMNMAPERASKAYTLSLSVTAFIIDEFGFSSLKRILTGLGRGLDVDAALRSSIFLSYEALEESWRASALR